MSSGLECLGDKRGPMALWLSLPVHLLRSYMNVSETTGRAALATHAVLTHIPSCLQ
jgi:hypothetical protein